MKVNNIKLNDEEVPFSRDVKLPKLKNSKIEEDSYKNYIIIDSKGKIRKNEYFILNISYYGKPRHNGI